MHASVGFPPHPLATHVLTWTRISEDVYTNASTQSCTCKMQGLFYLTFNCNSFRTHLFIILPKQVCFYLVAIYALHDGRNDFVCYSEVLQHWVHCRVCGEVGKQFDILTIKIYIIFNYLLFRACLKHMVVASHKLCCVPSQGESSHSSQTFKVLFIKGIRNSVFILTLFLCGR